MLKNFLLILFFSIAGTITLQAQTSCSCTLQGVCSTSLTCANGYQAYCYCQPSGCTHECKKLSEEPILDRPANAVLIRSIKEVDSNKIGEILTKSLGKRIEFEPATKNFSFDYNESKSSQGSYWEILEFLSGKGNLKINGYNLEVWKGFRESLLSGAELNICFESGSVKTVLSHISFVSGKHYSIIDGDAATKISGPVKGNLEQLIGQLEKLGSVTIVEN